MHDETPWVGDAEVAEHIEKEQGEARTPGNPRLGTGTISLSHQLLV